MGYRQHRNATATPRSFVGPASGHEYALVAAMDAPHVAAALGEHREVLEASLDRLTAREIAADRRGLPKAGRTGGRRAGCCTGCAIGHGGKARGVASPRSGPILDQYLHSAILGSGETW